MDKNKVFGEKNFLKGLAMCTPWKKFGQKMKNLEIFFDIFDFHACFYMHIKFRQNRTKFGSVRASFSKTGRHGISIFTNFNHLRIIFESGYMRWLLSFFLPYVHLRLTVPGQTAILNSFKTARYSFNVPQKLFIFIARARNSF